jgi:hypothetical protein
MTGLVSTTGPPRVNVQSSQSASTSSVCWPGTHGGLSTTAGVRENRGAGPTGNKFSGQIDWVQIDIGDDSQDHLIKAEDRLTIAMARQ